MANPFCKLEELTGPFGSPDRVILSRIDQGDARVTVRRLQLERFENIMFFEFDNQDLIPFQNPVQLKLGLNAADGQDLGVVIVSADDVGKDRLKQKFAAGARLYELTYGVR